MPDPRVLCLLATGFEEIETVAPVDLLRRAGAEVVIASVGEHLEVTGRCGMVLRADAILAAVLGQKFDLLFLPGGPGVKELRADGRAARLAKEYSEAGKPVAAICAAPTVLHDAGLLAGRRFTSHFGVRDELKETRCDTERVVEDGGIITSRGAGTAVEFGLTLVRRLFGPDKEREIAASIMA